MPRLREQYSKTAVPALQKRFEYKNPLAVPRITKVVVNTGFGKMISGKQGEEPQRIREAIVEDLSSLAGQRAALAPAKKSIAGFGVRQGTPVGAKVTLRGQRMYDFLERLNNVVLPRSRDFRGISLSAVDAHGNLNVGIREHIFFPEISPEKVRNIFGLEITVVTTAKNREEGIELFRLLGFPLQSE